MYDSPLMTRSCPNCKSEMIVANVKPLLFFDRLEEVTYTCTKCNAGMKRTFNAAFVSDLSKSGYRVSLVNPAEAHAWAVRGH